jgi:hypothetical protein
MSWFFRPPNSGYEEYLLAQHATSLKAFYPLAFDAKDASAQANHAFSYSGLPFSGPSPSGMKYPYAAKFDGAASQVRLEDTTYPLQLSRWTIACWFKKTAAGVTTTTAGGADGFATGDPVLPLVTKGRGESETAGLNCNWFLGINKVNNGSVYKLAGDFEESTGPNHRIVGATEIQDNQWYFGVFTFDGASMKLYLNGVEDAAVATSAAPDSASTQKAGIGTAYTSASAAGGFFAGFISGAAVWSEALTPAQIADLYTRGTAGFRLTPVFTHGAPDNHITHGASFSNWELLNAAYSGGAVVLDYNESGNGMSIHVAGLQPDTDYWCSVLVSAKTGSPPIGVFTDITADISGFLNPADPVAEFLTLSTFVVGRRFYFKLRTRPGPGPYWLSLQNAGTTGESLSIQDVSIHPIPERSAAKIVVHGDRTGNFNAAKAAAVSKAVLGPTADALNVVALGDTADTSNSYPACDILSAASCNVVNGSASVTAPAGSFARVVAGMGVTGTGIPGSTTVLSVTSDAILILSQNATGNGSVTLTFTSAIKTAIPARGGKVYTASGNHDYDGSRETEVDDYYGYAELNAGKTWFAVKLGFCELFFHEDNTNAEHANLSNDTGGGYGASAAANQDSNAGAYLLKKMAESTARWRLFLTHHPAYSSSSSGAGSAHARWDWAGLLTPVVLQAHLHGLERLSADGAAYITCAMGGGDHFGWAGSPHANSVWRETDTARSGYLKIHDGIESLVLEMFDTDDVLIDRLRINRT